MGGPTRDCNHIQLQDHLHCAYVVVAPRGTTTLQQQSLASAAAAAAAAAVEGVLYLIVIMSRKVGNIVGSSGKVRTIIKLQHKRL
jgi:hypothetical protein